MMASTPPLRSSVRTPGTPRHGPLHDNYDHISPPGRFSSRLASKRQARNAHSTPEPTQVKSRPSRSAVLSTPTSSRRSSQISPAGNLSPPESPHASPRRKSIRRARIQSPNSFDSPAMAEFAPTAPVPVEASDQPRSKVLSATTTMGNGMLPTPVKTPKKKVVPTASTTARALFRDQPVIGEEVAPPPRRGRHGKRYNGFSLESFSTENDGAEAKIQIFTDSKEKVPELDMTEENPFIDRQQPGEPSSQKGASKRRKISGQSKKDDDVKAALKEDGIVYVFRGKKVYHKLPEESEDSEETDLNDLGLTQTFTTADHPSPLRKIKPLTRRSIKPTRLFQSEKQIRDREAEMEDQVSTDVEGGSDVAAVKDAADQSDNERAPLTSPRKSPRSRKLKQDLVGPNNDRPSQSARKSNNSPFDSWKRVKGGSPGAGKGKKRTSDHVAAEEKTSLQPKKIKSR